MDTGKRKSILKQDRQSEKKDTKKRLAFAVKDRQNVTADQMLDSPLRPGLSQDIIPKKIQDWFERTEASQSDETASSGQTNEPDLQASMEVTHLCQSIKITPIGMCYVPQEKKNVNRQQLSVENVGDSQRNYYLTSLSKSTTRSLRIVIAGNKSIGEDIKTELIGIQAQPFMTRSGITLDIINEDTPSADTLQTGDFFILLVCFEILSSLRTISNVLKHLILIGAKPSINGLVLGVCPSQETYKSVLTLEEFHNFLNNHQLVHFWWSNTGRAQKKQVMRKVLQHIHISMGHTSGTSCLMKTLMLRGIKEYHDQNKTFE